MSCVSFLSPEQRRRLRASTADGAPLSSFASPQPSESKVARLRSMAQSPDPKIRESAALAQLTPAGVLGALAGDADPGVRVCVARNEHTPYDVLDRLAADDCVAVRGWVAANPATPPAVMRRLADDPSPTVRGLVAWAGRWPSDGG